MQSTSTPSLLVTPENEEVPFKADSMGTIRYFGESLSSWFELMDII